MPHSVSKSTDSSKRPRIRIGFSAEDCAHVVANIDTLHLENHVPLPGWPAPLWGESPIQYAALVRASKTPLPAGASYPLTHAKSHLADLAAWLILSGRLRTPQSPEALERFQKRIGALGEAWQVTRGVKPWSPQTPWIRETDHPLLADLRLLAQHCSASQMEKNLAAWLSGDEDSITGDFAERVLNDLFDLNAVAQECGDGAGDGEGDEGTEEDADNEPSPRARRLRAAADILRLIPEERRGDVATILRDLWSAGEPGDQDAAPRVSGIVAIVESNRRGASDDARAARAFRSRPVVYQAPVPGSTQRCRGAILLHPGAAAAGLQLRGRPATLREVLMALRAELQLKEDPSTGTSWGVGVPERGAHFGALYRWSDQPESPDEQDLRDRWVVAHLNHVLRVPGLSEEEAVLLPEPEPEDRGDSADPLGEVGDAMKELPPGDEDR